MSNVLQFPRSPSVPAPPLLPVSSSGVPDYTGRLISLNIEKIVKFVCGGFSLGPRLPATVVPPDAQMCNIHQAVLDGRLIDITDQENVRTGDGSCLDGLTTEDTGRKAYFVNQDGTTVMIVPKNIEEQEWIETQIKNKSKLILPPGFGEEDKYLLHFDISGLTNPTELSSISVEEIKT